MDEAPVPSTLVIGNAIERYYANVQELLYSLALRRDRNNARHQTASFEPGFDLPPLTAEVVRFFAPSSIAVHYLDGYQGSRLTACRDAKISLLDLMGNPATRTTKSLASLLMVARAVEYLRRTDRRVMLLTPSSANKATALRDAVFRAISLGLADPDRLQITSVVPERSADKLWSSPLSSDSRLRRRNPVVLCRGPEPSEVKALAQMFHRDHSDELSHDHDTDLWYTLDIENYKVADAMRAMAEYEIHPPDRARGRLHVHAVSSAYGLLGHDLGYVSALQRPGRAPRYFLVQHLGTPDMVLSLLYGTASRCYLPSYERDPRDGLFRQHAEPHFPAITSDLGECLEPTFYTHNPPTSEQMNEIIRSRGGGGIVVSLHECLTRYAQVRELLSPALSLPADPRRLREWSLVMAVTGMLNALDRGLIEDDDILIHGSGCYTDDDYQPIPPHHLTPATGPCSLREAVLNAVRFSARELVG